MALMFEQLVNENDKARAAFNLYLSQGLQRSLAKVAKQLGRSTPQMERFLSTTYRVRGMREGDSILECGTPAPLLEKHGKAPQAGAL